MPNIFKARTREGFTLKTYADLLQKCIKTACFVIGKEGITLCTMDEKGHLLFDSILNREKFTVYKYTEDFLLGVTLQQFFRAFRSVKKKDGISLVINSNDPNTLIVNIKPTDGGSRARTTIPIQYMQNLDIDIPSGYDNHILIPGADYQRACKEMGPISKTIHVTTKGHQMHFKSGNENIYTREEFFGENSDDDSELEFESDNEEKEGGGEEYSATFSTSCLSKFMKIAKLATNIQAYVKPGLPLMFKLPVGNLGEINIFIKSKEEIDQEKEYEDSGSDFEG